MSLPAVSSAVSFSQRRQLLTYLDRSPEKIPNIEEYIAPQGREVLKTDNLSGLIEHINQNRNLPHQKHLAILFGRQSTMEGVDLLEVVNKEVDGVDYALRAPQIKEAEFLVCATETLQTLETQTLEFIEQMNPTDSGVIKLTIGGPQAIVGAIWRHAGQLEQRYQGRIKFEYYQFVAGKYQRVIGYDEIMAEMGKE